MTEIFIVRLFSLLASIRSVREFCLGIDSSVVMPITDDADNSPMSLIDI